MATPILNLSPEDGGLIASAVLAVWACGWGFRVLVRAIRNTDGVTNESES